MDLAAAVGSGLQCAEGVESVEFGLRVPFEGLGEVWRDGKLKAV